MKWEFEEDFIVCKFYLSHVDSWKQHIDEVLAELNIRGFTRDKNKVQMRISNFEYLHTGHGLCHPAKQSRRILDGILKAQLTSTQLQTTTMQKQVCSHSPHLTRMQVKAADISSVTSGMQTELHLSHS